MNQRVASPRPLSQPPPRVLIATCGLELVLANSRDTVCCGSLPLCLLIMAGEGQVAFTTLHMGPMNNLQTLGVLRVSFCVSGTFLKFKPGVFAYTPAYAQTPQMHTGHNAQLCRQYTMQVVHCVGSTPCRLYTMQAVYHPGCTPCRQYPMQAIHCSAHTDVVSEVLQHYTQPSRLCFCWLPVGPFEDHMPASFAGKIYGSNLCISA